MIGERPHQVGTPMADPDAVDGDHILNTGSGTGVCSDLIHRVQGGNDRINAVTTNNGFLETSLLPDPQSEQEHRLQYIPPTDDRAHLGVADLSRRVDLGAG